MFVFLEFRGPFTEMSADTFAELEVGPSAGGVEIRESFPSQVFHLIEEFLELLDAPRHLFDGGGFGTRAGGFCWFCSCHEVWEKSSPRSTT